MENELAIKLEPQIEDLIIQHLKEVKLINLLNEKGEISIKGEGKPSDRGFDLDYNSFMIEKYGFEEENGLYKFLTVMWKMPYRIKKGQHQHQNSPDKSISGIIPEILFKLKFNQNTGKPELELMKKIKSSYRAR